MQSTHGRGCFTGDWTGGAARLVAGCVATLLVIGGLGACQTLREATALKDVQFRIDRVTDARLAGVELAGLRSYDGLSGGDVARLGAALAGGRLPLSFTLQVQAENPATNDVTARLVRMDWTLFLEETETVSGRFDREVTLPPGTPTDVPVPVELDLVSFFDENLQQFVALAAAIGGEGPPQRVKLRAQPVVETPLGRMKYPRPVTVVHEEVGPARD